MTNVVAVETTKMAAARAEARANCNGSNVVGDNGGDGGRWIIFLDGPTYLGKIPVGSNKKTRYYT